MSFRILLVDPNTAAQAAAAAALAREDYRVAAVSTLEQAKQQIALDCPDALITAIRLGAFNGLQLVILAKERGRETIAVVMSGYDHSALRKEAMQCGAGYLPKPFTREQVLAALQAATIS